MTNRRLHPLRGGLLALVLAAAPACTAPPDAEPQITPPSQDDAGDTDQSAPPDPAASWSTAFRAEAGGAMSAVWGSGPNDVFVVGGTPELGEIYHYDGTAWRAQAVPDVPLLVWVTGFAPDDAIAVGVGGGVVRFDGTRWTALDSGTTSDLWGVWGAAPDDVWIVGGTVGADEPIILHLDGTTVMAWPAPSNDRAATALFKVWGLDDQVFAVGEDGLIVRYAGGTWQQMPAGPLADDDFVALWGGRADRIVAVGGRGTARIARFDGTAWTTQRFSGVPGLNAVAILDEDTAVVGGANGYVGRYDLVTGALADESAPTALAVHGAWYDGAGTTYGVGGRFSTPYSGVALQRSVAPPPTPAPPLPLPAPSTPQCTATEPCGVGRVCVAGVCVPPDGCAGPDTDGDGWLDTCDNCTTASNPTQRDKDEDGRGDACDECHASDDTVDTDGDGVPDGCDRCLAGPDDADTDGDGVPDACDQCAAGSDLFDADHDGIADACDQCTGHDDGADADGDGVPDGCDGCAAGDDGADSDNDGVPNACDACPGFADAADSDGDGIADGCDTCVGADDVDTDADGVPDACDRCAGSDDGLDGDADGVPDGCDICAGSSDTIDEDGDGVPNGCDACAGAADDLDGDADGVPDGCDLCGVGDDASDADADGVPDACDLCDGGDDALDDDGDDVPDACDVCPGLDDTVDADGNGVPDGCCGVETDCPLGENCVDAPQGICLPVSGPDLELGQPGPYTPVAAGGPFGVTVGFQGFLDALVTYRALGFDAGVPVSITTGMTWAATGDPLVFESTFQAAFFEVEPGTYEFTHGVIIVPPPGVAAADLIGETAIWTVTVTDVGNPTLSATITQPIVLIELQP